MLLLERVYQRAALKACEQESDYIIEKFTDEGDFYRQHVLNPALFSLLGDVKGKTILDAGSGQGYLSRMLAQKGAIVTAVEPAAGLINYAKEREKKEKLGITYIHADLSTWEESSTFDIVVSNMVFMNIPDWKQAMKNCIKALMPGGLFIFSISHPCFDQEDGWTEKPFVEVRNYFDEYKIANYIGHSFHHMLSTYVNFVIELGCTITKMLEPQLPLKLAEKNKHHERDKHIPNFIVIQAGKDK